MRCPTCAAIIFLDISVIQGEVRRVEKSLTALYSQLNTAIGDPEKGGS